MPAAGIDIGSLTTETVILQGGEVRSSVVVPTGHKIDEAYRSAMDLALSESGLKEGEIGYIIATGYGRYRASAAQEQVTEITCHGRGSYFLDPRVRTVIDIGGQDSKVISLDSKGRVIDFVMNEKCAAGTGRFLEVMGQALNVGVENFSSLAAGSRNKISISSMCAVFAESEVVSLIAEGYPREDIIAGIVSSIAERTVTMVNRVDLEPEVMMTGGVAQNEAVVKAIGDALSQKIIVPSNPQVVGALGAALLAQERLDN